MSSPFEVTTTIKASPTSSLPYQVEVKILIHNQDFQEKLFQFATQNHHRLHVTKKGALFGFLGANELRVKVVADRHRDNEQGYLDDYLMNGYVYGFDQEYEAEEFSTSSWNQLQNFLRDQYKRFEEASKSKYYSVD